MARAARFLLGLLLGLTLGGSLGAWALRPEPTPTAPEPPRLRDSAQPDAGAAETIPPARLSGASGRAEVPEAAPPDASQLAETLGAARTAKDWPAFLRALALLGAADTLEADRVLVATLADEDVVFLEPIHDEFRSWLAGSTPRGVGDAVRRRIAADAETYGRSEKEAASPWAWLLADHGTPDDMIWHRKIVGDGDLYWHALSAFMRAARPETVTLARRILREPYRIGDRGPFGTSAHVEGALVALTRADPNEGLRVLEEEMDRFYAEPPERVARVGMQQVVVLYVRTLPPERLDQGVARVYELLQRGQARRPGSPVRTAFAAVAALEAALPHLRYDGDRARVRRWILEIRARLPWRAGK